MPSAYRGVIGARFGCLQMGMGELRVHGPGECPGGGPGRGHGLYGAAWSEPVNGVINSLWTTLVDKRSPSVQQVHADVRRLGFTACLPPAPPPSPPATGLDSPFDSPSGGPCEPALAWAYRRRGSGRCPLPAHQSRRHARRAGTEMTFERAELGPGGANDDGEGRAGGGWVRAVGGTGWFRPPRPPDAPGTQPISSCARQTEW